MFWRTWRRRRREPIETPRTEPLPDGNTVVLQGQHSILSLLRGWEDHPTQPLPRVVPSAAPPAPPRSPLLTRGAQWRTRNNRRFGRPDWYNR